MWTLQRRIVVAITQRELPHKKNLCSELRILKINKQSNNAAELWPQKKKKITTTAKGKKQSSKKDDDYDAAGAQRSATDEAHLDEKDMEDDEVFPLDWTAVSVLGNICRWQSTSQRKTKKKVKFSSYSLCVCVCVCVCTLLGVVWTNIARRPDMTKWKCVVLSPGSSTFPSSAVLAVFSLRVHNYYSTSTFHLLSCSFCCCCGHVWRCTRITGCRMLTLPFASACVWVCNFASCVSFFIFGALWVPFGNANCNGNKAKANKVNRQFLKRLMLWVIVQLGHSSIGVG